MASQTANAQFNVFLENDPVDYELVNANFEKLDKMALAIESGSKTASYSGVTTGNATWYYKKYTDGTVELYTKIGFDTMKCSGGSKAPYNSDTTKLYFPITLTAIDDVQMHLASNTVGWVNDITGKGVTDCVQFKVMSMESESDYVYKQVTINIKGRWK